MSAAAVSLRCCCSSDSRSSPQTLSTGDRSDINGSAWWLTSVRFLVFSDNVHFFFSVESSVSARCSSSRSSSTFRSCDAIAVNRFVLSSACCCVSRGRGAPRAGLVVDVVCEKGVMGVWIGLGSTAEAGAVSVPSPPGGMLMGKLSVRRFLCRAAACGRAGRDWRLSWRIFRCSSCCCCSCCCCCCCCSCCGCSWRWRSWSRSRSASALPRHTSMLDVAE